MIATAKINHITERPRRSEPVLRREYERVLSRERRLELFKTKASSGGSAMPCATLSGVADSTASVAGSSDQAGGSARGGEQTPWARTPSLRPSPRIPLILTAFGAAVTENSAGETAENQQTVRPPLRVGPKRFYSSYCTNALWRSKFCAAGFGYPPNRDYTTA